MVMKVTIRPRNVNNVIGGLV